jgi:Flp pilus assembly pilin Flp
MKRLFGFIKDNKGQAYAEYTIIFPAAVLLIIASAWVLGPSTADVYRHVTNVITGQKECVPQYDHEDNAVCDQADLCQKVEYEDQDSGSFTYDDAMSIDSVVIKAGKTYEVRRDDPFKYVYTTDDGCYQVTFKTNSIDWARTGSGPDCQGVSHIDHWQAPICSAEE